MDKFLAVYKCIPVRKNRNRLFYNTHLILYNTSCILDKKFSYRIT